MALGLCHPLSKEFEAFVGGFFDKGEVLLHVLFLRNLSSLPSGELLEAEGDHLLGLRIVNFFPQYCTAGLFGDRIVVAGLFGPRRCAHHETCERNEDQN